MSNTETLKEKYVGLSRDTHDNPLPLTPAKIALAQTRDTDISASTEITLDTDTRIIEVTAVGGNVYLKYGTTAVTNANFDEFIQLGQTRHYVIPKDSSGDLYTAINLIDDGDSATVIVIEK